jgi:hypothetical protein
MLAGHADTLAVRVGLPVELMSQAADLADAWAGSVVVTPAGSAELAVVAVADGKHLYNWLPPSGFPRSLGTRFCFAASIVIK